MKVSEYKKFINEELDRALRDVGDVPVVIWTSDQELSEYLAERVTIRVDEYQKASLQKYEKGRTMLFLIGE